jgi:hypothetical protein
MHAFLIFFPQNYAAETTGTAGFKKDSAVFSLFLNLKINFKQKKECRSTLEIYKRCLDIHSTILLLAFPSSNIPIVLSRNSLTCDLYFSRSKDRRI